jgi:hypothetical protein
MSIANSGSTGVGKTRLPNTGANTGSSGATKPRPPRK